MDRAGAHLQKNTGDSCLLPHRFKEKVLEQIRGGVGFPRVQQGHAAGESWIERGHAVPSGIARVWCRRMRHLRGAATTFLLVLNLSVWGAPILFLGLLKRLAPSTKLRRLLGIAVVDLAEGWVASNNRILDATVTTRFDLALEGIDDRKGHSLIISNHTSWVDIIVLQRAFHGKTAFLRFFIKQQLIWLPIVGQACWALDFPFMKRYSREELEKHPEKRGADLETTRRACEHYREMPVAILNFVEGTRFTPEKKAAQKSPYRHLLAPRRGGVAFVLASLGDQIDAMYDVTLAYPGIADPTFWSLVTNRMPAAIARVQKRQIPSEFFSAAVTEPGPLRDRFREWIDTIWSEKDDLLDTLLDQSR